MSDTTASASFITRSANWSRLDWAALVLTSLAAAAVRLPGLNRPIGFVFDEVFYAQNACRYVIGDEATCGIAELASRAHPPLGNWMIGVGVKVFGYEPFGWRIAAAAAGIMSVALLYVLAWRLVRGILGGRSATVAATASTGLLAADFLHLVHSRVGMIDVFITLFVIGAMLAIVLDRDRRRDARPSVLARLAFGRPWRLLAGACLGAATATKWSGAYVGLALVALTIAWEVAATPKADGLARRALVATRREALPTIVAFAIVPLVVYLTTYIARMPGELLALPWEAGSVGRGIWEHQWAMLEFHTSLTGHHPYESPPWSWPLLKRPVAYSFVDEGGYREILAVGNPLVWWPGIVAIVALAIAWGRWGFDVFHPSAAILAGAFATYLPWLVLSGDRSQVFLWYLLPTIPFLCLAVGSVVGELWWGNAGRLGVTAYGVLVAASLAFFFPVLSALPVDAGGWRQRMLFTDCARPNNAPTLILPDDQINTGPPPAGWCWI